MKKKYLIFYGILFAICFGIITNAYVGLTRKLELNSTLCMETRNVSLALSEMMRLVSENQNILDPKKPGKGLDLVSNFLKEYNRALIFNDERFSDVKDDIVLFHSYLSEFRRLYFQISYQRSNLLADHYRERQRAINEVHSKITLPYTKSIKGIDDYYSLINAEIQKELNHFKVLQISVLIFLLIATAAMVFYSTRFFQKVNTQYHFNLSALNNLKLIHETTIRVIKSFVVGEYDTAAALIGDTDENILLKELRGELIVNEISVKRREWAANGIACIAEIFRKKGDSLNDLYNDLTSFVVKYIQANQGALFIHDAGSTDSLLLVSCYAYDKPRHFKKNIQIGDGLVGQCFLEGLTTYLSEVPPDYVNITSGLGHATPRCLLIIPLNTEEKVIGVLEIASFTEYDPEEIRFIEGFCNNIANTIERIRVSENTKSLLTKTQVETEILRVHEEELKYSLEASEQYNASMSEELTRIKALLKFMESRCQILETDKLYCEINTNGRISYANDQLARNIDMDRAKIEGRDHKLCLGVDVIDFYNRNKQLASVRSEVVSGIIALTIGGNTHVHATIVPVLDSTENIVWFSFRAEPVTRFDSVSGENVASIMLTHQSVSNDA